MEKDARILVAGSDTLAGAAILAALEQRGYRHIAQAAAGETDLTDRATVAALMRVTAPAFVFVAAGEAGGIHANRAKPASLMLDNLLSGSHLVDAACRHGVTKLLYLGSSCMYPRDCPQPMRESYLMTGPLEPTSAAYAIAKIAGITLCQAYRNEYGADFVAAIPANPFGPGDEFSPKRAHVIPALIERMHAAKRTDTPEVGVWGTGAPRRDFIYSADLADACLFFMERYSGADPINVGSGIGVTIRELAEAIKKTVGYRGLLRFDNTKPDGMLAKVLDTTQATELGWRPRICLEEGLKTTYDWFLTHAPQAGR